MSECNIPAQVLRHWRLVMVHFILNLLKCWMCSFIPVYMMDLILGLYFKHFFFEWKQPKVWDYKWAAQLKWALTTFKLLIQIFHTYLWCSPYHNYWTMKHTRKRNLFSFYNFFSATQKKKVPFWFKIIKNSFQSIF